MTVRERYEETEKQLLSKYAAFTADSRGRDVCEPPCDYRTVYQRDRDRVIHSKAFRRLKHKTQVFLSPEGDHYRTRLTHTLEVSQIARTVARALRLNEDLTEAIALAHDLGHTPFGHAGERALDRVVTGGFRHYEQGVRVVELLERDGHGLNLTWEVRDGILHHTKDAWSATREGRVVRLSDRIAYIHHDMDDALRAGVLCEDDIPTEIREVLGEKRSEWIGTLVSSLIYNSGEEIRMDDTVAEAFSQLHSFMYEALYLNPTVKSEEVKAEALLLYLFDYYTRHPEKLPQEYRGICEREGAERAAADHIAGMTDNYALEIYGELCIPHGWNLR